MKNLHSTPYKIGLICRKKVNIKRLQMDVLVKVYIEEGFHKPTVRTMSPPISVTMTYLCFHSCSQMPYRDQSCFGVIFFTYL